MFTRPTAMAAAFINAAAKNADQLKKVDHQRWIARRVAGNCERKGFAEVREYDKRPQPPVTSA